MTSARQPTRALNRGQAATTTGVLASGAADTGAQASASSMQPASSNGEGMPQASTRVQHPPDAVTVHVHAEVSQLPAVTPTAAAAAATANDNTPSEEGAWQAQLPELLPAERRSTSSISTPAQSEEPNRAHSESPPDGSGTASGFSQLPSDDTPTATALPTEVLTGTGLDGGSMSAPQQRSDGLQGVPLDMTVSEARQLRQCAALMVLAPVRIT